MKHLFTISLLLFSFTAFAQKPSYFITARAIYQSNDTVIVEVKTNLWFYSTMCDYLNIDGVSDIISGSTIKANLYYEIPTIVDASGFPQYCPNTDTATIVNVNGNIHQIELNLYTYQVWDTNMIDTTNENSKWMIFIPLNVEQHKLNENPIKIYPNPSSSELYINAEFNNDIREAKVLIYNSVGEMVYVKSYPVISGILITNIRTDKLPPGVYTLQLNTVLDVRKKQFVIQ
ncbi:MAG: T9SS type A sorting domain-containing protein [Chitinophagales bacterium]|nr:T9SS type A sorting domain-containing protein [Chitinophagales bacterium]